LIESRVTRRFWKFFAELDARRAYALFRQNPAHPSLHFKKLQGEDHIYSTRIGLGYRALGVLKGARIVWYWIGAHSEYDRLA
jgi:hypothetical protein